MMILFPTARGLRRDFLVGLGMVADIVQHLRHRLSILGGQQDFAIGFLPHALSRLQISPGTCNVEDAAEG
ncbi:hypothetical protein HY29_08565 [Hyphomonas beringensis]|uniref:Uncharacterized protein n=1 Tax=Hyphomonas beringensis TaxID=1280946 RepID=A0A062UID0_9PROT|nr:hypothetical protein [Hyphomonas beringensis]KCZ56334.1 hypothetical protein HY29_08565 [Hyphomonas beringensis]